MKYDRIYNFSAGPSILPEEVLESVRDNLMNYDCLLYTSDAADEL